MSVRVRVTAVAVVVTALALAAGGWGFLRSIESTRLGQIAAETDRQLELVRERLEAGMSAAEAAGLPQPGILVQVLDARGDVISATAGAVAAAPIVSTRTGNGNGMMRVETHLPGSAAAVPLQLRWEQVQTPAGQVTLAVGSPLSEVTRSLDAVRRSLWVGVPILVALVGAVAWFVTGRALSPVEAMRREAEAITHSTLHRRVPDPGSGDEVGRLARTLNQMLDRLEAAADRQRRFVADASHELRTPVATLRTELEVARLAGDETALREAIDAALAEEGRIEALLADLLLLASVEETPPVVETVDLGALALAEAERGRPVPVEVTGTGTVSGNARQLERVVRNLLDNAARHAGSTVRLTVAGSRITVEDDGPGIAEGDRERVFERFTRLDEARTRDAGGSGLGLSIVRAVVDAHGGTVMLDDSPDLGGARFTVTLPTPSQRGAAIVTTSR